MDGWSWFDTQHKSLPGLLVKAGFNVYLGNDRGTRNSLSHKSINVKKEAKKYFDFSFAELGKYDMPAVLNFVRSHAKSERVIYIGYQQGATSALYAYSKGPEAIFMKTMVSDVFLLAPCIFFSPPT